MTPRALIYGLLAEFGGPTELIAAARQAHAAGYRRMDAYTPYPVEELTHVLGLRKTRLPWVVFAGGLLGCVGGFALQYWSSVIAYPLNIGGRPLNSWPAFLPVTFELTVLLAALFAVLGMLAMNGLPMPYHPLFAVPRFALASRDRFFLCIEARDPKYEGAATRAFLETLHPREITEVPR